MNLIVFSEARQLFETDSVGRGVLKQAWRSFLMEL